MGIKFKYTLSLLFCLLFPILMKGEIKRAEFMGIPINGNISAFTTKLNTKGFKSTPNNLPVGTKTFSGLYFGENADLYVFYIPTTKIVYRVKVAIECYNAKYAETLRDNFKEACATKFGEADIFEGNNDGRTAYHVKMSDWDNIIMDEPKGEGYAIGFSVPCYGYIDIYISSDYPDVLQIDFYDRNNYEKYQKYLIDSSF